MIGHFLKLSSDPNGQHMSSALCLQPRRAVFLIHSIFITGPRYFCTNLSSIIAYLKGGQDMYEQGLLKTVNVDKLAEDGGLDSLTLNSLYDEGAYRASQQPVYGSPAPNLFEAAGPFGMSA
ncbi:hypothetical protein Tco_1460584, partial [Tanacetum coccineum]